MVSIQFYPEIIWLLAIVANQSHKYSGLGESTVGSDPVILSPKPKTGLNLGKV